MTPCLVLLRLERPLQDESFIRVRETIANRPSGFTKNGAQACDSAPSLNGRARRSEDDKPERLFPRLWSSFRTRMNESAHHDGRAEPLASFASALCQIGARLWWVRRP